MAAITVVWFDYTCPYSRRLSDLLDTLGTTGVRWRPFALAEQNRDDEGAPVWDRPEALTRPALLALALHETVVATGDADRFRRETVAAFAQRRVRPDDLRALAEAAAAATDEAALREGLSRAAAGHEEAQAVGVFGTLTVATADDRLAYLKVTDVPADTDACRRIMDAALTVINDVPELGEMKRPSA